ncbi:MAG: hypothetical protein COV46_07535 [Deltaproteobacteria bacterium CG11_big_fil_rev_8_21_14_0_20_49_13]|nr:MAG: hypothetical protein COV46_07535 [Deltaproteobacteria bacterium CG11_big_fil_rev_8_21_14_0_20_49_13]
MYAKPPCFPFDDGTGRCAGYRSDVECGVVISNESSDEFRKVAAMSGFTYVLSEEDVFRFYCAKGIAEKEIASRTGIYDSMVNFIFGREYIEKVIHDNELMKVKYHFDYFLAKKHYDSLNLRALRNRAKQFVERAQDLDGKTQPRRPSLFEVDSRGRCLFKDRHGFPLCGR